MLASKSRSLSGRASYASRVWEGSGSGRGAGASALTKRFRRRRPWSFMIRGFTTCTGDASPKPLRAGEGAGAQRDAEGIGKRESPPERLGMSGDAERGIGNCGVGRAAASSCPSPRQAHRRERGRAENTPLPLAQSDSRRFCSYLSMRDIFSAESLTRFRGAGLGAHFMYWATCRSVARSPRTRAGGGHRLQLAPCSLLEGRRCCRSMHSRRHTVFMTQFLQPRGNTARPQVLWRAIRIRALPYSTGAASARPGQHGSSSRCRSTGTRCLDPSVVQKTSMRNAPDAHWGKPRWWYWRPRW